MTTANANIVDHHRKASWHSLDQVDVKLQDGELEAASQTLWEAAAHGVKAAAARRGWPNASVNDLMKVVIRLMKEEDGPIDLNSNLLIAHSFDRIDRAWEIPLSEYEVIYAKGPVAELLRILESMD